MVRRRRTSTYLRESLHADIYSKKGLIDDIDLEGLSEEMSIKKVEDYMHLDNISKKRQEAQEAASASSGECEIIEDIAGRMQQREQNAEVIQARKGHVSDVMIQPGFIDLWLQLGPGQALAFRWVDEKVWR